VALLSAPGGMDDGMALAANYLETHPDDYAVAGVLGVAMVRRGSGDAGMRYVEQGLLADKPELDVAYFMAMRADRDGNAQEARQFLDVEMKHHPLNRKAAMMQITMLGKFEDWPALVELAKFWSEKEPENQVLAHNHAQAVFNTGDYARTRTILDAALKGFPSDARLVLLDANLLAKEGRQELGQKRFAEAQKLQAAEQP